MIFDDDAIIGAVAATGNIAVVIASSTNILSEKLKVTGSWRWRSISRGIRRGMDVAHSAIGVGVGVGVGEP